MTIDEKVVEMRFDNKQFEEGIQTSTKSIENLKESLSFEDSSKSLENVGKAAEEVDLNTLSKGVEYVKEKFSAMEIIATTALINITNKAINAGESMIKSLSVDQISSGWSKYADKTAAVQTIMAATSKDFDDEAKHMAYVNEQLDKLNWYTDETSAGFMDMVNNIGKFTSNGVKLDTAVEAMQGIANWGYISGAGLAEQSRAMYNLSQALSAGSVKLIDWKSIANANMATVEFKQTAIDTAVELGTLKKVGDGVYKTLAGTEVSVTKGFDESLKDAWFSSDVLLDTLSKYGKFTERLYDASNLTGMTATELLQSIEDYKSGTLDISEISEETGNSVEILTEMFQDLSSETYDLGRRSLQAGQEAKTFTEAIDSVKDAVSSGWMNTFEIIFGDYKEAKKLWTAVANELYDTFAEGGNARNEMLEEWKELGGRDVLIEAMANAWRNLKDILGTVKEAFREVFPAMTAERLKSLTDNFSNLIQRITPSEQTLENLRKTFQGFFSVISILLQPIKALAKGFFAIIASLKGVAGGILKATASFGSWLSSFNDALKKSKFFEKELTLLLSIVKKVVKGIDNAFKNLTGLKIVDAITEGVNKIKAAFQPLSDFFMNFGRKATARFTLAFIKGFQGNFSDKLRAIIYTVTGMFNDLVTAVFDSFKRLTGIDLSKIANIFSTAFVGIGNRVFSFFSNFITSMKGTLSYAKAWYRALGGGFRGFVGALVTSLYRLTDAIFGAFSGLTGIDLSKYAEMIRKIVIFIKNTLIKWIDAFSNVFVKSMSGTLDLAKTWFNVMGGGFKGIIAAATHIMYRFTNALIDTISAATGMDFTVVKDSIREFIIYLKTVVFKAFDEFAAFFKELPVIIMDSVKEGGGGVAGIANAIFNVLISAITAAFNTLSTIVGVDLSNIKDTSIKIVTAIRDTVVPIIRSVIDFVRNHMGEILGVLRTTLNIAIAIVRSLIAILAGVPKKINEIFKKLTGKTVGEAFDDLKKKASDMLAKIKEVFGGFKHVDTSGMDEFTGKVTKATNPLATLFEGIKSVFSAFWEFLKKLTPLFKSIANLLGKVLSSLGNAIGKAVKNADTGDLLDLVRSFMTWFVGSKIGKFFQSLRDGVEGFSGIGKEIRETLGSVRETLEAYQKSLKAKSLLSIAIAVAILAAAIIVLGDVDADKLAIGLGAISAIFLEISKTTNSITEGAGSWNKLLTGAAMVFAIGIAVLLLSMALKKLSKMDSEELTIGLMAVGALMAELVLAMKVMSNENDKRIMKGAIALVLMALAVKMLVKPIKQLGEMPIENLKRGAITIGALMLAIGIFANMMSGLTSKIKTNDMTKSTGMFKTAVALLVMVLAIKMLVKSVIQLGSIDTNALGFGLLGLIAIMGAIVIFASAIKENREGDSSLIKASVGLAALVLVLKLLVSDVKKLGSMGLVDLAKGLIALMVIMEATILFAKGISDVFKDASIRDFGRIATNLASFVAVIASITKVVKELGSMDPVAMAAGLLGLVVIMGAIVLFAEEMDDIDSKNIIKTAAATLIYASAIATIGGAFAVMKGLSPMDMAVGLVAIAGALLIMVAAFEAIGNGEGNLKTAAVLVLMAFALDLLVPAMKSLGGMKIAAIGLSLITIAAMFGIMVVALKLIKPVIPIMIEFAKGCMLLAVSVLAAGVGILALAVGLTTLAAGGTGAAAALVTAVAGVIGLIPLLLTKVGEGLVALLVVIVAMSPEVAEAVIAIINNVLLILNECVPQIVSTVLHLVDDLLRQLKEYLPSILDNLFSIIDTLLEKVGKYVGPWVDKLIGIILEALYAISKRLDEITEVAIMIVVNLIAGLAIGIEKHKDEIVDAIWMMLVAILDLILAFFGIHSPSTVMADIGKNIIQGLVNGIIGMVSAVLEAIGEIVAGILDAVVNLIGKLFEKGVEIVTKIIEGIGSMIAKVTEAIGKVVSEILGAIVGLIGKLFDKGVEIVTKIIDGIKSVFEKLVSLGGTIISKIISGITGAFGKLFDIGGKIFDKIKEGMIWVATVITKPIKFLKSLIFGDEEEVYNEGYGVGEKAAKGISAALADNAEEVKKRGQAIGLTLKENISESSENVVDDWGRAMENIYGAYSKHTDDIVSKAELAKYGVFNSWEEAALYFTEKITKMEETISEMGERLAELEGMELSPKVEPVVNMDDLNILTATFEEIKAAAGKLGIDLNLPNQEGIVTGITNAVSALGAAKETLADAIRAMLSMDINIPIQIDSETVVNATVKAMDGALARNLAIKQRLESYYRYANGPTW